MWISVTISKQEVRSNKLCFFFIILYYVQNKETCSTWIAGF